jgi:choline dehydrogenase
MGSATDNNAVVDERLRIRNVSGLRVIDASIMPQITSSGVNAPSIMIGERGAQFIIEDNPVIGALSGQVLLMIYSYRTQ